MKRSLVQLIGTTAVVAMLGLPVALSAANRTAPASAAELGGIVKPVELIGSNKTVMDKLGFVDSQGEVLLLMRSRADRAAYGEARRLSNDAEWVHLVGVKTVYDGVPAIRIQRIWTE